MLFPCGRSEGQVVFIGAGSWPWCVSLPLQDQMWRNINRPSVWMALERHSWGMWELSCPKWLCCCAGVCIQKCYLLLLVKKHILHLAFLVKYSQCFAWVFTEMTCLCAHSFSMALLCITLGNERKLNVNTINNASASDFPSQRERCGDPAMETLVGEISANQL